MCPASGAARNRHWNWTESSLVAPGMSVWREHTHCVHSPWKKGNGLVHIRSRATPVTVRPAPCGSKDFALPLQLQWHLTSSIHCLSLSWRSFPPPLSWSWLPYAASPPLLLLASLSEEPQSHKTFMARHTFHPSMPLEKERSPTQPALPKV